MYNESNVIQPRSSSYRIAMTLKRIGLIKNNTFYNFIFSLQKLKKRSKDESKRSNLQSNY